LHRYRAAHPRKGPYENVAIIAVIETVIKLCHVPLKVLYAHLMEMNLSIHA
jgi:hypothetical protein